MMDRPRPEDVNVDDYEPVERRVRSTVFSLRLSPDELGAIATEAARADMKVGTLIKALVADGLKRRARQRASGPIFLQTTAAGGLYTPSANTVEASSAGIEPERDVPSIAAAG